MAASHRALGVAYRKLGDRRHAVQALQAYLKAAPKAKDAAAVRRTIAQLR